MDNKIIIFFHIYYTDLIDEYLWYLNNVKLSNYNFDLYVSICNEVLTDIVKDKLLKFKSDVIITICENRGADIGGFLSSIRKNTINLSNYIAWIHIHTKQSSQYGKLSSYLWRGQLLNDTLISSDLVNYCSNSIKEGSGIIGSNSCIYSIENSLNTYKSEKNYYNSLCNRLNIKNNNTYFVAGTIFWANIKILQLIINSDITPVDFETKFEHYGLLQHGFERIFGNISTELNLPIVGINLDIDSTNYYNKIKIYDYIYSNNIVFKINNKIIIPNDDKITQINKRNKLLIINNKY